MSLYKIDQQLLSLVDPETGEILDYDAFCELKVAREEKIEGMALWCKNLTAEAAAIRQEENNLAARRRDLEKKANSLKDYLSRILEGNKFSTARVACSFRKTKSVQFEDSEDSFIQAMEAAQQYEFLKYAKPEVNRSAITDAIKAGREVPGAHLVEKSSMSIK